MPFLDKEFIDTAMTMNPEGKLSGLKNRMEKRFLRKACSTPIALEWDAAFKNMIDPSGRAVKAVHQDAY